MHIRPIPRRLLFLLLATLVAACAPQPEPPAQLAGPVRESAGDPHSYSRPDQVVVRHMTLDLDVDFESRRLRGSATLGLEHRSEADAVRLDARDLEIRGVYAIPGDRPLDFSLSASDPLLGERLSVDIDRDIETIRIDYATAPEAAALQWLEPSQTSGEMPFLFSQSQPHLARSWIPCQDSPGVRTTYEATIRVPPAMMAVMSASNPVVAADDGVHTFVMSQPIPCYLVALAVGELEFRQLGRRTGVYAAPAVVEAAAWEFADVESMLDTAEGLYGPYRWDRYDILVLPPSFPFGGMENPRLTFATPTILAGDRSLVSLVAHELAHSWSGNLVTNATWNDTWLNEGFTTYFESRIMEEIYGRGYSEMLEVLDYQGLRETLAEMGPDAPDSRLHLDLAGRDPDLGSGTVAYVKGALFLRWLEGELGRQEFDRLLSSWFEANAFRSQDADGFREFLRRELELDDNASLAESIDEWIFTPNLPANHPVPRSQRLEGVEAGLESWRRDRRAADLVAGDWTTHEWLFFLRNQPEDLTADDLAALDRAFSLTASGNDRILSRWLELAVRHGYEAADPAVEAYLLRVGRRWLVQSIYQEMIDRAGGRERAEGIYARARPGYHGILRTTLEQMLAVEE